MFAVAAASGEPPAPASPSSLSARLEQAVTIVTSGRNLFEAYRILHRIDPDALERESPGWLSRYWWAVGRITYELGRYDELDTAAERMLSQPDTPPDSPAALQALYYRASGALADPHRFAPKDRAIADMKTIVARAGPDSQLLKLLALLALGKLVTADGPALVYLDQARRMAIGLGRDDYLFYIRAELARRRARTDPQAGYALLQSALHDWQEAGEPWSIYGWEARLEVVWAARPPEEAMRYSLELLDRIESMRREQEERGAGSMGFFSVWVRAYRRVIGLLLRESKGSPDTLALAFRLSERMRARLLVEDLRDGTGVDPACASPEAERKLLELRHRISGRQKALLSDPSVDRETVGREIENLMLDEESIHREIRCDTGPVKFVELPDLERMLSPSEALLVFQTGSRTDHYGAYDGGSWVFVVTSDSAIVLPLPEDRTIRLKRDALVGSLRRRDGTDAPAAVALYDDLFRGIMSALPPSVEHLIVVPQGAIHGLPFAALRPDPSAPPLIDRFRFSYVPSATIWAELTRVGRPARRSEVMAFADPALGAAERAGRRSLGIPELGALPWARRESSRLIRSYRGLGWLFEGSAASEAALKRADPENVGLLLFAAHAVVDERSPRRSAIVLAPGGDDEDGLLQPPEIAELPLEGSIVALSGCQSATGMAIEGEGLLSLARSFFSAGSTAVVGNLWPARDDEAGRLFGEVYENLADGEPLAAAVGHAQRTFVRAGAPTEAWAGIVVLGDGRVRLPRAPGPAGGAGSPMVWLPILAAGGFGYFVFRAARARDERRGG